MRKLYFACAGLFTVLLCNAAFAAVTVTTTLDTTTPPPDPAYTASTGQQTGRLVRNGTSSTCAAPKANPGLNDNTPNRRYDAYVFTAATSGCVTVRLTQTGAASLFALTYNNAGFNPANPSTNYLADAGGSPTTSTYSFNVTAGQQFTVVVHEVFAGNGIGQTYTLNVSDPVPPTAAAVSVGGRVLTATGRGIARASVTLTSVNGETQTAITNPFGYYHFPEVPAGGTYIFSIRHKTHQFGEPTRVLSIIEERDDINFFALP